MTTDSLKGGRILVVEDEFIIALESQESLQDMGCVVVGPASKLEEALRLARDETLDAAILDVTIRGGQVFPVAEQLLARQIPFALASGYGGWALPESLRDQPRLTKPFTPQELEERVRLLCGGSP
jgi:DNA-binding response OmpR family regulator